jgi:hypothetical protein
MKSIDVYAEPRNPLLMLDQKSTPMMRQRSSLLGEAVPPFSIGGFPSLPSNQHQYQPVDQGYKGGPEQERARGAGQDCFETAVLDGVRLRVEPLFADHGRGRQRGTSDAGAAGGVRGGSRERGCGWRRRVPPHPVVSERPEDAASVDLSWAPGGPRPRRFLPGPGALSLGGSLRGPARGGQARTCWRQPPASQACRLRRHRREDGCHPPQQRRGDRPHGRSPLC